MRDLRFAWRTLARTPVVSLVVVLSLALGIGANTAMYSLLDQVLLRALPVRNPEDLVFFYHPGPVQGRSTTDDRDMPAFSYPMFRELQEKQAPFTGLAGFRMFSASLGNQGVPQPGRINLVSGNYFDLLGVRPAMGRLLSADDDRTPGGHPVAVLSHGYWTNRLGGRPDVLNQKLVINGFPMTVVGVTQMGFQGETLGETPEAFVPLSMKVQMTPRWDGMRDRQDYWVNIVGRLKRGSRKEQAAEVINVPYRGMLEEDARLLKNWSPQQLERFKQKKILLKPASEGRGGVRREGRAPLILLMGITAFVLLIACANAANLLIARAAARRKEIAVRLSLGASRARLLRQLLTESCMLALAGGALGLVIARWTLNSITAFLPPEAAQFLSTELDWRVLLYCLGASLATGLLFGLFPAVQATKTDVAPTLKDQGDLVMTGGVAKYFRNSLVAGQVALSLLLLATAGLFAASLVKLTRVELGIDTDRMITFSLRPELAKYTPQQAMAFFEQVEDRMAALPGVKMVAGTTVPVISGNRWRTSLTVEGYQAKGEADSHCYFAEVGPGYFATLGIPLLAGREFTRADRLGAPKAAIVNEAFARLYFGGQSPIGRRFVQNSGPQAKPDIEIAGVVKDSRYAQVRDEMQPVFYLPYRQNSRIGSLVFYARTEIEPEQFGAVIRKEMAALDPNIPVDQLKTMRAQVNENIFIERMISILSGTFASLATLLAAVGLYGVLAYTVARRTREIGIRMALGAQAGDVRRMVARDVLVLVGTGAAAGIGGALAAGRFFESMLFNVKASDPLVLAAATLLLTLVALAAGSLPAQRAARVDPMTALRYE
ncbi:MAG: ABC transporter permease [Acidobacteria bacterium]|nr:ABC transporter permease [Acidobacteriota bacterium]